MTHPTDNLVRARHDVRAAQIDTDTDSGGRTLHGHFAVFDEWTEIDSLFEGRFLERIAPTAFDRTFTERGDRVRILYDHGSDPSIGNKPLGAPDVLRADEIGAYYESELYDTSYVNELLPALRDGQLGASFRFRVVADTWSDPREATEHNPQRLSERTITDVDLYELGPVTFPAYESATAGVRSATDEFCERMLHDPLFVARLTERAGLPVVQQILNDAPVSDDADVDDVTTGPGSARRVRTASQRQAFARLAGVRI